MQSSKKQGSSQNKTKQKQRCRLLRIITRNVGDYVGVMNDYDRIVHFIRYKLQYAHLHHERPSGLSIPYCPVPIAKSNRSDACQHIFNMHL